MGEGHGDGGLPHSPGGLEGTQAQRGLAVGGTNASRHAPPAPAACWPSPSTLVRVPQGYESVLLFLASLPGVLEQRDGRRETALAVARRRRNSGIQELLLEAGAKPEHASFGGDAGDNRAGEEEEYCSW